ncbi:MAG: hypothetical protein MR669_00230 [Selenomonadaceae bacterium]|nr:hypothetical protein [Selenomonadaceae bacterium]
MRAIFLAAFLDHIEGKAPKGKFTEIIADAVEAAKCLQAGQIPTGISN